MIKQTIPFPSITVCTEGTTLWPTVQSFHEQFQVSPQEIPTVSIAFMRLSLTGIDSKAREEFYNKGEKLSPFCKEEHRICKFVFFINSTIGKKIEKGSLHNETAAMAEDLVMYMFSPEEEGKNKREQVYYEYLEANATEKNKTYQQTNLIKSFLFFNLLRMMKGKVVHNSDDTFEKYIRLMEENIDDLDCQNEIITLSESFDWIFSYEQDQPSSNLSLTWTDVLNKDDFVVKSCHLEREWNIENTAPECYLCKTEE